MTCPVRFLKTKKSDMSDFQRLKVFFNVDISVVAQQQSVDTVGPRGSEVERQSLSNVCRRPPLNL